MAADPTCDLCRQDGGEVVYRNAQLRVVLVDEPQYPGFCRVIWQAHAREMTDLSRDERDLLMDAVIEVESALRETLQPHKINLASLGNQVPHVHWHVIPRYTDDAHFSDPIWAAQRRDGDAAQRQVRAALLPALRATIARRLNQLFSTDLP